MSKSLVEKQLEFVNYRFGMFIHFNSATFQFAKGIYATGNMGLKMVENRSVSHLMKRSGILRI